MFIYFFTCIFWLMLLYYYFYIFTICYNFETIVLWFFSLSLYHITSKFTVIFFATSLIFCHLTKTPVSTICLLVIFSYHSWIYLNISLKFPLYVSNGLEDVKSLDYTQIPKDLVDTVPFYSHFECWFKEGRGHVVN